MSRPIPGTADRPGEETIYIEVLKNEAPQELIDEYSGVIFEKAGRQSPTSRIYDVIVEGSLAVSPDLNLLEGSSISGAGALIELPDGRVLYGFSYNGALERLRKRFRRFCEATGRMGATPKGQTLVFFNGTGIPLSQCQAVFYTPKRRPFRSGAQREAISVLPHEPRWHATTPARQLARDLLDRVSETPVELLEIYEFAGDSADEEAHDDDLQDLLEQRFIADFDRLKKDLVEKFGKEKRSGTDDDPSIPVSGAFRWAAWEVGARTLYLTAAHEDRELPYLLFIGVADRR